MDPDGAATLYQYNAKGEREYTVVDVNTNGGQLSGGRTHGLGYVHEACTQLWGRAGERQVKRHDVAVTAAGGGPLGGSLLLVRE